ncbi:hypothetical protein GGI17_006099 [Coemansia sp. S146]|nr:hypothetical protein GGI17_006099 [Coemansia sp. S146]
MSRHRAVRNLNLEEELYDEEDDGAIYDELQDVSEEDQARLIKGIEAVRCAIGPETGIEDREIKESLWYYFFDEEATIAWLQKTHKLKPKNTGNDHRSLDQIISAAPHRPGPPPPSQPRLSHQANPIRFAGFSLNQPLGEPKQGGAKLSLKSLAASGSAPGLAKLSLGALSQRSMLTSPSKVDRSPGVATRSPSVVGKALAALKVCPPLESLTAQPDNAKPHSTIPQGLSLNQTGQSLAVPVLKNFAGRQLPALKSIALGDRRDQIAPKQLERRQTALGADSLVLSSTTLYAEPSPLASFILSGIDPVSKDHALEASRGTVVAALEREIRGLLVANRGEDGGNMAKTVLLAKNRSKSTNCIAGDMSFLSLLVGKGGSKESKRAGKPFAFDTPSPDDKVLAAQSSAAAAPSPKPPKPKPKAKGTI